MMTIYQNKEDKEIMRERTAVWNGMGKEISYASNAEQAMELGGLNYTVEKRPLYTENGMGESMRIKDMYSTVRSDNDAVLGVAVTDKFTIVQNADAFAFTDSIVSGQFGHDVHYETAGTLKNGAIAWVLARLPEHHFLGDKFQPYLLFTNGHNGKNALNVVITDVRVVCQNTMNLALKTGDRMFSFKHHKSVAKRLQDAQRVIQNYELYQSKFALEAERLYGVKLSDDDYTALLDKFFPVGDGIAEGKKRNNGLLRGAFNECYLADDIRQFRGTAWGFVNAMSDLAFHCSLRNPKSAESALKSRENKFMSLWNGNALLDSAYAMFA